MSEIKEKNFLSEQVSPEQRQAQLNAIWEQLRQDQQQLKELQCELMVVLEENVLEMERYFEKSADGTVTEQELETLNVRAQLNKHLARYYKLASRQQQLLKEKASSERKAFSVKKQ